MCGFVGSVNFNQNDANKAEVIAGMNDLIAHRGPDSVGYFTDDVVSLGFRRLSILDLQHGSQPLPYDNDRFQIIFNGEIYNHEELRDELIADGYTFNTTTDTEVIVATYKKYQEKTASLLRGMFAFIIWDTQEAKIYGARDHFGIKPLYYSEQAGTYYFASESKAIEKIMTEKKVNEAALQHYFTFQYVPGQHALIENIKRVIPGHYFTLDQTNGMTFTQFYTPTFKPQKHDETILAKKISDALYNSVEKHMRSDVTVGSFLSGGVDSSIIVSLARKFNPDLKTFSVGFEREGFSEIDVAQETAEKLGVKNYSRIITADDFINEFDDFVWHMDDPLADPAAVPQYFLSQEARKQCKVALSGEGADELFGGYTIYNEPNSLAVFDKFPHSLNRGLHAVGKALPQGMKGKSFLLRGTTPLEERYLGNAKIFVESEKKDFLKTFNPNQSYMDITQPFYALNKQLDPTTRMQDIDMHTWLVDDLLHNADRTTMAASLELRTPFVDKEVFKVASEIPTSLKLANGTTKYILRKAAEEFVPEHVLYRAKLGFPVPIRFWLKDELYDWAHNIIETSNTDAFIDRQFAFKMLEDHRTGSIDYSRKLWTILTFMRWYDLHLLGLYSK